ncbi:hypothetical protein SDC9_155296 [bioreactor metagenome]|uniref:Uncharacterized protein n=1 Tax=bioreactor metagenome TaxID=1076179 RepID=A0A645F2H5_9ZZZZ
MSRSRRGSTPSSPAGPGGAASTSRDTPWWSGSPGWTRGRWPAWPASAPTRCAPPSARRTTWPSTCSTGCRAARCVRSWSCPSPSFRPTGRSSVWPAGSRAARGTTRISPPRPRAISAISWRTPGSATRSTGSRPPRSGRTRSCGARRPNASWPPCAPATSSGCRAAAPRAGWSSSTMPTWTPNRAPDRP